MVADVGYALLSPIIAIRAGMRWMVVRTELTSLHYYWGVRREEGFQPVLPMQEEGAANEVLDVHFVLPWGCTEVIQALD